MLAVRAIVCDLGILQPPQRNMPWDFARNAKVREVDAESWQNPPGLENFFIDGCATVWTVALKCLIFKQKKGAGPLVRPKLLLHGLISATISCHCPFKIGLFV
jgi:hypothetical protein